MSPPKKDTITDQYINILITKQDPSLPPIIAKHPPGNKPLFNDTHGANSTEDNPNDFTDNSLNEKEDYVNKLKVTNNKDNDDEYKDENTAALKNDESLPTRLKKKKHLLNAL